MKYVSTLTLLILLVASCASGTVRLITLRLSMPAIGVPIEAEKTGMAGYSTIVRINMRHDHVESIPRPSQHVAHVRWTGLTGAAIGFVAAMLIYNFYLFLNTRERLHLYYCASAFGFVVYLIFLNETAWGTSHTLMHYLKIAACLIVCTTQLCFIATLVDATKYQPRLYRISSIILFSLLTLLIALQQTTFAEIFLIFVAVCILVLTGVSSINQKLRHAIFLAWVPFLTVVVFSILSRSGLVHFEHDTGTHLVTFGVAWVTVILSIAVQHSCSDSKLALLEEQKIKIQSADRQKGQLKQIILDNTEEIMTQNEKLIKTQDMISRQNQKLEAQNKAYEKLRELVLRQNQNLELAVKKRTVELATTNHQLKETIQKLERFSNITAHNLRGPLARILGLCTLFDLRDLPPESTNAQIIEKLHLSARELDAIIRDIGMILSVQTQVVERETIVLRDWFKKTVSSFTELDDSRFKINFQTDIDEINVVPEFFDRIFSNLISNSIKFKRNGLAQILVRAIDCKKYTIFHYHDNGVGFDSERFKDKIFEPYQRFHSHSVGKGLGLFLVKTQVAAMGGTITLWSRENQGIRIKIILPTTNAQPDSDSHAGQLPPGDPIGKWSAY